MKVGILKKNEIAEIFVFYFSFFFFAVKTADGEYLSTNARVIMLHVI